MNIKFNKIDIENFRSIDKASVVLADRGTVVVKGINEYEDKATSNGSGKSSLFEAIVFALFDETSSGEKDVANRITNNGYTVTLDFSIDATHYVITRYSQGAKSNVVLYKNDQDISARNKTDTNKLVLQILGITKSIFLDSIFLSQGAQTNLASLTPTARKERLEVLTNTDYTINQFKEKLKEKQVEYEANCVKSKLDLSSIDGKLDAIEKQRSSINDSIAKIDAQIARRNALGNLDEIDNEIEVAEMNLSVQNSDLDTREQEILDYENKINDFRKSGDCNQVDRDNLNEEITKQLEVCNSLQNDISNANLQINQCNKEINRLENEIKRIKNSDTCPTCGRKYDNFDDEHLQQTIKELEINRDEELNKIMELNNAINSTQQKLDIEVNKGKDLRAKLNILDEQINEFKAELTKMDGIKQDLMVSKQRIVGNIKLLQTSIAELRSRKDDILKIEVGNKDEFLDILKNLDEEENRINTEKENIVNTYNENNELCDVTKNSIQLVTKEFRTYLLQNSIQYLNKVLGNYSAALFSNSDDKIKISGDDTKLDITLGNASYESLSGGEKTRVNIALLLAQKSLANSIGNMSCNLIILDEVLGYCDTQAEENVISLISRELSNLETIFFVSHKEIAIGYDSQLIVVKGKDGLSRIKSY